MNVSAMEKGNKIRVAGALLCDQTTHVALVEYVVLCCGGVSCLLLSRQGPLPMSN